MKVRSLGWNLGAALLLVLPASAFALQLDCGQTYRSVALGTTAIEFHANIRASGASPENVEVTLESHVPGAWLGQFCQESTGICYLDNAIITVPGGSNGDLLRIDFIREFANPQPRWGWLRIEAHKVSDPTDKVVCTYTLYSGMPVPAANLQFNCNTNSVFLATGESYEFHTPMKNASAIADSAMVRMESVTPGSWFSQYCQESTGVCYFDNATLPLTPGLDDFMRVDFFMFNQPGRGRADIEVHSARNPSLFYRCFYRVFLGNQAADTPELVLEDVEIHGWAEPNPFAKNTTLRFYVPSDTRGSLDIYSADGRRIRTFGQMDLRAGVVSLEWDGLSESGELLPAGAYYYRLSTERGQSRGLVIQSR